MSKNGIGPQGLGNESHNGFWIGSPVKQVMSPAKCWKGYKRVPGTKEGTKGSCIKK